MCGLQYSKHGASGMFQHRRLQNIDRRASGEVHSFLCRDTEGPSLLVIENHACRAVNQVALDWHPGTWFSEYPRASNLIKCFTILGWAKVLLYSEHLGVGICQVQYVYVTSFNINGLYVAATSTAQGRVPCVMFYGKARKPIGSFQFSVFLPYNLAMPLLYYHSET